MTELIDGGTPDICDVDPVLEPGAVERIRTAAIALGRDDAAAAAEPLRPVAETHPDWRAPWLVEARRAMMRS